jgi:two-component system LytT family response regulator
VIRVLVVDDEPLGVKRLVRLLANEPGVEVVGSASDGVEAVSAIREMQPDLVFLDIQMPRKTGLEVAREIGPKAMPVTIFVTAYDEHALKAFELAAVDYLVKPYDDERFEESFARARKLVEMEDKTRTLDQLFSLLETAQLSQVRGSKYLDRIAVQSRGKMTVVPVAQIEFIAADGIYAELHVGGRRHLVREAIQSLEERLDPGVFLRVHRSAIVRMDLVETLTRTDSGDYEVQLKGGRKLRVGRSRRAEVQRRLGRL